MNYSVMDECMQALFEEYVPLSPAQRERLSQFCCSQMLAGSSHLSKLARWLGRDSQQTYREQWLRRLLEAPFVRQEDVYEPWFKPALSGYQAQTWHLVLDRTHLVQEAVDWVTVALSYRQRAIPMRWMQVTYGGAPIKDYVALLKSCQRLIPHGVKIVLHGDAEFGAIPMLQFLRQHNWDYILGQRGHYQVRSLTASPWQALDDYRLPQQRGLYLENIVLTKEHQYPFAQVFGLLQKDKKGQLEKRFYATALPLTVPLRRLGKRRWSIEPYFQDMKSSGWHLDESQLHDSTARDGLLVLVSCTYLWLTCLGRWLCKTQQRHCVDSHATRQLSLFRLGLADLSV